MAGIEYGPPGHKGVDTLMAVHGDETPAAEGTRVLTTTAAIWGVGVLTGSRRLKDLGLGATAAVLVLRWLR